MCSSFEIKGGGSTNSISLRSPVSFPSSGSTQTGRNMKEYKLVIRFSHL